MIRQLPNYTWIKFPIDSLNDPIFMRCTDATIGIYLKLYLLAGKADSGGLLCNGHIAFSLEELAWSSRTNLDAMQKAVQELIDVHLVRADKEGFVITRFSAEQGPGDNKKREQWAERQRKHRERFIDWEEPISDLDLDLDIEEESDKIEEKESDIDIDKESHTKVTVTRDRSSAAAESTPLRGEIPPPSSDYSNFESKIKTIIYEYFGVLPNKGHILQLYDLYRRGLECQLMSALEYYDNAAVPFDDQLVNRVVLAVPGWNCQRHDLSVDKIFREIQGLSIGKSRIKTRGR